MSSAPWLGADSSSTSNSSLSFGKEDDVLAREPQAVLLVRNTFLDSASTEGALLGDSERTDLLCSRGNRRAATCGAALLAKIEPSSSECEDSDEAEPNVEAKAQADGDAELAGRGSSDLTNSDNHQVQPQLRMASTCPLGPIRPPGSFGYDCDTAVSPTPLPGDGPVALLASALGSYSGGDAASGGPALAMRLGEPAIVRMTAAGGGGFTQSYSGPHGRGEFPHLLPEPVHVLFEQRTSQPPHAQQGAVNERPLQNQLSQSWPNAIKRQPVPPPAPMPPREALVVREERVPVHRGEFSKDAMSSVGSAGHHSRECKPCAFLDSRKGCVRGGDCPYCHLCEPGEKKRRQKEKRKLFSTMRKIHQIAHVGG